MQRMWARGMAAMTEPMTCAICMEEEGEGGGGEEGENDQGGVRSNCKPFTTLECGHCFHVHCALHWFRYENNTCPLCRSRRDALFANTLTDAERIRRLRRKKKTLPVCHRRKLEKMDEAVAKCREARGELRRLRTQHRGVFKSERTLQRTIMQMEEKREQLHEQLANLNVHGVPYMQWDYNDRSILWMGDSTSGDEEASA